MPDRQQVDELSPYRCTVTRETDGAVRVETGGFTNHSQWNLSSFVAVGGFIECDVLDPEEFRALIVDWNEAQWWVEHVFGGEVAHAVIALLQDGPIGEQRVVVNERGPLADTVSRALLAAWAMRWWPNPDNVFEEWVLQVELGIHLIDAEPLFDGSELGLEHLEPHLSRISAGVLDTQGDDDPTTGIARDAFERLEGWGYLLDASDRPARTEFDAASEPDTAPITGTHLFESQREAVSAVIERRMEVARGESVGLSPLAFEQQIVAATRSVPIVELRFERYALAAATGEAEARSRAVSKSGFELRVTGVTSGSVHISVTAQLGAAQPLDIVQVASGDTEGAMSVLIPLLERPDGTAAGGVTVPSDGDWIDVSLILPRSISEFTASSASDVERSVRMAEPNERRAWIAAARTLPEEHPLRLAVLKGLR